MIVVHGWWASTADPLGCVTLWVEDSTAWPQQQRRSGRPPKIGEHPYALSAKGLAAVLAPVLSSTARTATCGVEGSAVLSLPTHGRRPAPSPQLLVASAGLAEEEPDGPEAGTRAAESVEPVHGLWRLPTVRLGPDAALGFLRGILDGTEAARQEAEPPSFGTDLRFFAALATFASSLAARGRVLPTVRVSDPGQGLATWSPLVTGADALWLRTAAARVPPSLRAVVAADGVSHERAVDAIAAATDALVDAAVRAALGPARGRRTDASWRSALRGPERTFAATVAEVRVLATALAQWQQEATNSGPVRACFRLVEPLEPDGPDPAEPDEPNLADADGANATRTTATGAEPASWRVEFGLQAADEPSLVVDADRVWRSGGALRALARHVADPQETLLAELGRAVRLYPDIERALRTARPSELTLDTAAAHVFLAEAAPMLMASGFGVLLPGWWTNPSTRLGARLRVATPGQPGAVETAAGIGQAGLVDFRWHLAVGEHTLSEQEVTDLVEAQQPLVRVRGQWLQVDPDRLARARSFLSRRGKRAASVMTVGEVLQALGAAEDGPGDLPVIGVDAEGWLGDLLSGQCERRIEPVPAPPGFAGTLRPYQERGLAWLAFLESAGLGGLLADDMGLGKTIQLLALIARELDPPAGPTLLVCPMSLVGNWQREAARFTPALRVHVHHGAERALGKAFEEAVASSDLVLTTYALLARDAAALRKVAWHRVVLDEAQAVKNAATKAALAARSLPAARRFAVTGTPVENRLADLWSLMEFANPRLLGTATQFKARFATPVERYGDDEARTRLRAMTQPFVLRRLKTDTSIITDLPPKLEMEVVCTLTAEQAALYQAVVADMLDTIARSTGIQRRGLVLATMTKLKQVCNHPAHFLRDGSRLAGRSGKLARLEETLDEVLAADERALLFTQYAEFGHLLRAHLTARFGREVAFLHGGVSKAQRDVLVDRFQEGADGPALFVLSLKAGGTGLNLTAANHVIHLDRWWNPAVENQATDRAFRIGQQRRVQVRKLICTGTLEERIDQLIEDKTALANLVVGDGEGWLTELSTGELRRLFALSKDAVDD